MGTLGPVWGTVWGSKMAKKEPKKNYNVRKWTEMNEIHKKKSVFWLVAEEILKLRGIGPYGDHGGT